MLSLLWFEESVMHLPEQPGRAGELGAFGGDLGVRMHFGQGEMTEDEPHPPAKMPLHLVDHGMRQRTMLHT
jgi:hypothetical protein